MFQNKRYLTCGVYEKMPLELQLFMWACIDSLPSERDYFQVFRLEISMTFRKSHTFPNSQNTIWNTYLIQ